MKLLIRAISFFLHHNISATSVAFTIKITNQVETLVGLLHNPHAFTSPVDEVVAWGEDTSALGWGLWEAPARFFINTL
jgi:hypothetical protein